MQQPKERWCFQSHNQPAKQKIPGLNKISNSNTKAEEAEQTFVIAAAIATSNISPWLILAYRICKIIERNILQETHFLVQEKVNSKPTGLVKGVDSQVFLKYS